MSFKETKLVLDRIGMNLWWRSCFLFQNDYPQYQKHLVCEANETEIHFLIFIYLSKKIEDDLAIFAICGTVSLVSYCKF